MSQSTMLRRRPRDESAPGRLAGSLLRALHSRQYDLAATFALLVFLIDPGLPSVHLPGLRALALLLCAMLGIAAHLFGTGRRLSGPSLVPLVSTKAGS